MKKSNGSFIIWLIAVVVIALLFRFYVGEVISIDGPSMTSTILNHEKVWLNRLAFLFDEPEQGDVVVFKFPDDDYTYIKRVIGVPGDSLQFEKGTVIRNGEDISEQYWPDTQIFPPSISIELGDNEYFMVGDNINDSRDSRAMGPVPGENIMGRAAIVIYPFKDIRSIQ